MKVIFDIDGTLTDFNIFIQKYAIPYFKRKYFWEIINPDELEIEDIFDICNVLMRTGISHQEAVRIKEKILNDFWVSHRFIQFFFQLFSCESRKVHQLFTGAGCCCGDSFFAVKDMRG